MRKSNTQTLGQAIKEYLRALNIDKKINEVRLINSWEEVIGKTIAKATTNIYIKNKTLFVYLNSSVIRNELFMLKEEILKALNKKAGEKIIERIVLK